MAYDEGLAERIRGALDGESGITEKKMFGGIAFLLRGKMFVGIVKDDLMVRVGPAGYPDALKRAFARPMDFTGKPMEGYVFVAGEGTAEDDALEDWVGRGLKFAATLTPRETSPSRGRRARSTSSRKSRA
jgi:TfoX/Sxy family transcriptional regulator of competence genes